MFSQIAIVALGLFLVGIRNGDYVNVGLGILVGAFATSTLYRLKTGK